MKTPALVVYSPLGAVLAFAVSCALLAGGCMESVSTARQQERQNERIRDLERDGFRTREHELMPEVLKSQLKTLEERVTALEKDKPSYEAQPKRHTKGYTPSRPRKTHAKKPAASRPQPSRRAPTPCAFCWNFGK